MLTRDYRAPKSLAPLLVNERISMFQKIVLHHPNLNYVFLLDPNDSTPVKSAYTLHSERILSAVLNFGINVKTFWPSKQDDTLAHSDEWTIAYAPLWARSKKTGEKKLSKYEVAKVLFGAYSMGQMRLKFLSTPSSDTKKENRMRSGGADQIKSFGRFASKRPMAFGPNRSAQVFVLITDMLLILAR